MPAGHDARIPGSAPVQGLKSANRRHLVSWFWILKVREGRIIMIDGRLVPGWQQEPKDHIALSASQKAISCHNSLRRSSCNWP